MISCTPGRDAGACTGGRLQQGSDLLLPTRRSRSRLLCSRGGSEPVPPEPRGQGRPRIEPPNPGVCVPPQRALSRTPSSRRRQPRSLARPTWRRCSHPRSGQHPKQESTARVESGGPPKGGGSSGTSAPQSHLISCKSLAQEATTIAPWLVPQAPSHVWLWGYAPGTGDDDSQAVAQSRWDDQRPGSGGTRHMQPREGSTGHRGEAHRVAQQGDGTIPLVLPEPPLFGEGSASHLTPSRVEGQDRMRTEPAVPRG